MYKNHEGYRDHTAGEAIRRVMKHTQKKKDQRLRYQIGELESLHSLIKGLNHEQPESNTKQPENA